MKVLMLNGSPHEKGSTFTALNEMIKIFDEEGIEVELMNVGKLDVPGCKACYYCLEHGRCAIDDVVNEIADKLKDADGFVIGTPVYYASPNATVKAILDRLFYSTQQNLTMKVGAAVASCRRGGIETTVDNLNKYFMISGMPIASGQYWNGIHGNNAEQAQQDLEGMQMMRTLARNMAFMIKSFKLGEEKYGIPEKEAFQRTNFIRK